MVVRALTAQDLEGSLGWCPMMSVKNKTGTEGTHGKAKKQRRTGRLTQA